MDFIKTEMSEDTVLSKSNPVDFDLDRQFDIVFALSFFSHMPDRTWGPWLEALFRHVRPGGSLIFTTHGQISREKLFNNSFEFSPEGFWFATASEQHDIDTAEYGTTMTSTVYVTRQIFRRLASPIALLSEGFWWGHQDVYVVAKLAEPE